MFLQRAHQYRFRHLEPIVEIREVFIIFFVSGRNIGVTVLGSKLGGGDSAESSIKVVDAFNEIGGEFLDGEVAGRLDVALCSVLEVAEIGDRA